MLSCGNNFFVWVSCCPPVLERFPASNRRFRRNFVARKPLCKGALYRLGLVSRLLMLTNACRATAVTSAAHEVPGSGTLTQKGRESQDYMPKTRSHQAK